MSNYPYTVDDAGAIIDSDGCHWESLWSFAQGKCIGFCCCGILGGSVAYVLNGLKLINEPREKDYKYDYTEWAERCNQHFGNEQSKYFFFYWCDKEELTEHGGSVPGWLSEKGEELMTILSEALEKIDE